MTIKDLFYRSLIAFSTAVLPLTACSNNQDNYQVLRSTSVSHEQTPQIQQVKHETARPTVLEYRFKDIPIPQINSSQEDIHDLYLTITSLNPGIIGKESEKQFSNCHSTFNNYVFMFAQSTKGEVRDIMAALTFRYCPDEFVEFTDKLRAEGSGKITDSRLEEILKLRFIDPLELGLTNDEIVSIQKSAAIKLMNAPGSGIKGDPINYEDQETGLRAFVAREDVPDIYMERRPKEDLEWYDDPEKNAERLAMAHKKAIQELENKGSNSDESRNTETYRRTYEEESEPESAFEPEPSRTRGDGKLRDYQENIEGNSLLEWIVQEGGAPIEGAVVRMTMERENGSYEHQGTTNSDGRAIVELSRGDWKAAFLYKDRIRVRIGGRDIQTGNKVIPETHTITPSDLDQADPGETISDEIQVVDLGFMYEGRELGGKMLTLKVQVETIDDN